MAIDDFKRLKDYFSSFPVLKAADLDLQFNMISDYLNQSVLPVINSLIMDSIPGSNNPAHAGKFLQNVGDGTVTWTSLSSDNFEEGGISLDKLKKYDASSVIVSDENCRLKALPSNSDNQSLVRTEDSLHWSKLTGDNLEDRTITSDNIILASITNDNLPSYLLQTRLLDNSLDASYFANSSITTAKLKSVTDGDGLTADKLSPDLAANFANTIWSNIIPDNFLSPLQFDDWQRIFKYASFADYQRILNIDNILASKFAPTSSSSDLNIAFSSLTSEKIAPASISGERLHYYIFTGGNNTYFSTPSTTSLIAENSIGPEHLRSDLKHNLGY